MIKSFTPPKISATKNSQSEISPTVKSAAEILLARFAQPKQNQPPQNLFKANTVTLGAPVPVGGTPKPVTFTPSNFRKEVRT